MALPRRRSRPALAADPTLYLGIWLAGDPDVAELTGAGFAVCRQERRSRLTAIGGCLFCIDRAAWTGVRGGRPCSSVFANVGDHALSRNPISPPTCQRSRCASCTTQQAVPAAALGAGLEVSTAEIRFLRSTPLVEIDSQQFTNAAWSNLQRDGADLVCPTTGKLEFFMQAKTGEVGITLSPIAKIPASRTAGHAYGRRDANCTRRQPMVWDSDKQSRGPAYSSLKGQDGQTSVDGNYAVRISHIEEVTATFVTGVAAGGGGA